MLGVLGVGGVVIIDLSWLGSFVTLVWLVGSCGSGVLRVGLI